METIEDKITDIQNIMHEKDETSSIETNETIEEKCYNIQKLVNEKCETNSIRAMNTEIFSTKFECPCRPKEFVCIQCIRTCHKAHVSNIKSLNKIKHSNSPCDCANKGHIIGKLEDKEKEQQANWKLCPYITLIKLTDMNEAKFAENGYVCELCVEEDKGKNPNIHDISHDALSRSRQTSFSFQKSGCNCSNQGAHTHVQSRNQELINLFRKVPRTTFNKDRIAGAILRNPIHFENFFPQLIYSAKKLNDPNSNKEVTNIIADKFFRRSLSNLGNIATNFLDLTFDLKFNNPEDLKYVCSPKIAVKLLKTKDTIADYNVIMGIISYMTFVRRFYYGNIFKIDEITNFMSDFRNISPIHRHLFRRKLEDLEKEGDFSKADLKEVLDLLKAYLINLIKKNLKEAVEICMNEYLEWISMILDFDISRQDFARFTKEAISIPNYKLVSNNPTVQKVISKILINDYDALFTKKVLKAPDLASVQPTELEYLYKDIHISIMETYLGFNTINPASKESIKDIKGGADTKEVAVENKVDEGIKEEENEDDADKKSNEDGKSEKEKEDEQENKQEEAVEEEEKETSSQSGSTKKSSGSQYIKCIIPATEHTDNGQGNLNEKLKIYFSKHDDVIEITDSILKSSKHYCMNELEEILNNKYNFQKKKISKHSNSYHESLKNIFILTNKYFNCEIKSVDFIRDYSSYLGKLKECILEFLNLTTKSVKFIKQIYFLKNQVLEVVFRTIKIFNDNAFFSKEVTQKTKKICLQILEKIGEDNSFISCLFFSNYCIDKIIDHFDDGILKFYINALNTLQSQDFLINPNKLVHKIKQALRSNDQNKKLNKPLLLEVLYLCLKQHTASSAPEVEVLIVDIIKNDFSKLISDNLKEINSISDNIHYDFVSWNFKEFLNKVENTTKSEIKSNEFRKPFILICQTMSTLSSEHARLFIEENLDRNSAFGIFKRLLEQEANLDPEARLEITKAFTNVYIRNIHQIHLPDKEDEQHRIPIELSDEKKKDNTGEDDSGNNPEKKPKKGEEKIVDDYMDKFTTIETLNDNIEIAEINMKKFKVIHKEYENDYFKFPKNLLDFFENVILVPSCEVLHNIIYFNKDIRKTHRYKIYKIVFLFMECFRYLLLVLEKSKLIIQDFHKVFEHYFNIINVEHLLYFLRIYSSLDKKINILKNDPINLLDTDYLLSLFKENISQFTYYNDHRMPASFKNPTPVVVDVVTNRSQNEQSSKDMSPPLVVKLGYFLEESRERTKRVNENEIYLYCNESNYEDYPNFADNLVMAILDGIKFEMPHNINEQNLVEFYESIERIKYINRIFEINRKAVFNQITLNINFKTEFLNLVQRQLVWLMQFLSMECSKQDFNSKNFYVKAFISVLQLLKNIATVDSRMVATKLSRMIIYRDLLFEDFPLYALLMILNHITRVSTKKQWLLHTNKLFLKRLDNMLPFIKKLFDISERLFTLSKLPCYMEIDRNKKTKTDKQGATIDKEKKKADGKVQNPKIAKETRKNSFNKLMEKSAALFKDVFVNEDSLDYLYYFINYLEVFSSKSNYPPEHIKAVDINEVLKFSYKKLYMNYVFFKELNEEISKEVTEELLKPKKPSDEENEDETEIESKEESSTMGGDNSDLNLNEGLKEINIIEQRVKEKIMKKHIRGIKDFKIKPDSYKNLHKELRTNSAIFEDNCLQILCKLFIYFNLMKDRTEFKKIYENMVRYSKMEVSNISDELDKNENLLIQREIYLFISKLFKTIELRTEDSGDEEKSQNSSDNWIEGVNMAIQQNELKNTNADTSMKNSSTKVYFFIDPDGLFIDDEKDMNDFLSMAPYDKVDKKYNFLLEYRYYMHSIIELRKYIYNSNWFVRFFMSLNYNWIEHIVLVLILITNILMLFSLYLVNPLSADNSDNANPMYKYIFATSITNLVILGVSLISMMILERTKFLSFKKVVTKHAYEDYMKRFFDRRMFSFAILFVIGVLAVTNQKFTFLFALQLFYVFNFVDTMKLALYSVQLRYAQFLSAGFVILILVLFFSMVSIIYFQDQFSDPDSQQNSCNNMIHCFLSLITNGIRGGGGLGFPIKSFDSQDYWSQFVVEWLFYFFIILVMLNVINGIIVDTFQSLREENSKMSSIKYDVCYICSLKSSYIESYGVSFKDHTQHEHYIMSYLHYIYKISKAKLEEMNDYELQVYKKIQENKTSFFPHKKALSLDDKKYRTAK